MAKPRVHEVAKELGLTSKEVLEHLEKIGEPAKSHSSSVDEAVAERLRAELGNGSAPAKAASTRTKPAATKPAPAPAKSSATKPAATKPAPAPAKSSATKPAATKPAPVPNKASTTEPASAPAAPAPPTAAAPETAPAAPATPAAEIAIDTPADAEAPAAVQVHHGVTVKDFADKAGRPAAEVVKALLGLGEMVTVTQSMSDEALFLVADELGIRVQIVDPGRETADEEALLAEEEDEGDDGELVARAPVVTVMGHVDHGKTAILDAIRKTNVAASEAGGITQHIGAYQVDYDGREITFIDTPGHEAFTAMRARGAQVTDIAVLVVAADDGVMPQTVEAIDHARAAKVPIVVAVNKVDKPEADPARVRQQLSDYGLLPEEWGGETVYVDVSAKQRTNLDGLLEMIVLTADVQLDLRANPSAGARGVVIEAHLDKGRGPVATVLVKRGTLHLGDILIAGASWTKIRAMLDEDGTAVNDAKPGEPVQVLGWQSVPQAGDDFRSVSDEREARGITSLREHHKRESEQITQPMTMSLETLLETTAEGQVPELNLLLKADTQGSVEALEDQLAKLDQSLVRVTVLRKGAGAITENDITLAQASNAIVIGFNVIANVQARQLAEEHGVDVRTYRVIYQAVQDIEKAAKGLLGPELREIPIGQAEVRATFRVPRLGVVAGCMVTDGVIRRNAKARLVRDGTVVYESNIASLRRFKDDQREVAAGFECGIGIEGFQDVKEGDVIQAFEIQEVAR
ncbi:MAG: translation initiation factor [Actinomycetota bacterium]|jgi:translation initiation factor IF-2|nr:translation initiation factor [Actinomycetota bacterium]